MELPRPGSRPPPRGSGDAGDHSHLARPSISRPLAPPRLEPVRRRRQIGRPNDRQPSRAPIQKGGGKGSALPANSTHPPKGRLIVPFYVKAPRRGPNNGEGLPLYLPLGAAPSSVGVRGAGAGSTGLRSPSWSSLAVPV